jgi:hypothetical protein
VLIVTMFEDDATVFTAMRAGAQCVLKDAERRNPSPGSGRQREAIQPGYRRSLSPISPHLAAPHLFPGSPRGDLDLIARRNNNKIATVWPERQDGEQLCINILGKLQVADRSEAIVRARAQGSAAPYGVGAVAVRYTTTTLPTALSMRRPPMYAHSFLHCDVT